VSNSTSGFDWWESNEWSFERGDVGAAGDTGSGTFDMGGEIASTLSMQRTPLGDGPTNYDVRSVWPVRPIAGFDFNYNFSGTTVPLGTTTAQWTTTFVTPIGYRLIPLIWDVNYDFPGSGPAANSTVSLQNNGIGVPLNQGIIIGAGGQVRSFFIVEENTQFGIIGANSNNSGTGNININCYGYVVPVTDVSLAFSVANPIRYRI